MKHRSRKILGWSVAVAAVAAAGILAVHWYARLQARIPRAPAGGLVREFSSERAVIADMKLTRQPTLAELAGMLRAFAACREVEGSGNIHLGGSKESVPFRIVVRPGAASDIRAIEFATRSRQRPMIFALQFNAADGTGNFDLQGRFRQSDLAFLQVRLPDGLDFQGEADIQLSGTFADGKINSVISGSGRCLPASILRFGAFRLLSPGRFELKREEDTTPVLTFPDARWSVDELEILSPALLFGPRQTIHFTGMLRPLPPHYLSMPLSVAGQLDGTTGDWSFHAESRQALDAGTPRVLARLTALSIDGRGSAANGTIGYNAEAASLAVRPDSDATRLWSASEATLRGENKFTISGDGAIRRDKEQYALGVREISVAEGFRRWQAEKLRLHWDSAAESPQEARFSLEAEQFQLVLPEEELRLTGLQLSGNAVFVREQLRRLGELRLAAEKLRLQAGNIRLEADNWEGNGEFDAAGKNAQEELSLQLQGRKLRFVHGELSGEALQPQVSIRQELPVGANRAPVRHYRISSAQLSARRGPGEVLNCGKAALHIRFDAATGQWALQQARLDGLDGQMALPGFGTAGKNGAGHFSARAFSWNDPAGSAVLEDGAIRFGAVSLQRISGRIPLADGPASGELQIGSIRVPGRLVESLNAELTRQDGVLSWKGRTHAGVLSGGGFFFRGSRNRGGEDFGSVTEFTLPPTSLRGEYPLVELAPGFPGKWRLLGKLGGEGSLVFSLQSALRVRFLAEFTGDVVDRQAVLTRAEFKMALPLNGGSRAEVTGGRLDASDFSATQIQLELLGTTPQRAEFSRWGGQWQLKSGDPAAGIYRFRVRDLVADDLFRLSGWRGVVDTPLSGEVTLSIRDGNVHLAAADLSAGRAGKLRTGGLEPYRYLDSADPNALILMEFAAAAGKEFNFQTFRLQYAEHAGQNRLRLTADGRAAGPLPFVYSGGGFRKANATEYGFDSEVEIRGDYLLPAATPENRP